MSNALGVQAIAPTQTGSIVFIGSSPELDELRILAAARGHEIADTPDGTIDYAVVDDDVLDGICTAQQAALLVAVRALAVPVLTAYEARTRFQTAA